jgi:enamine deaminase RidA (YjgF/YER057c/UK114 family)
LIKGGSRFEDIASFSRAVVDGDMIYLSGTTGQDRETGTFPDNAAEQAELAFSHIESALTEAGTNLADVLRVVVYLADRDDLMPVCEVVGRKFADIRPANTTVIAALALPEMKVEIEVTARRGSAG